MSAGTPDPGSSGSSRLRGLSPRRGDSGAPGAPDALGRVPAPLIAVAAIVSVQVGAALAKAQFDVVGSVGAASLRLVIGALALVALIRPRVRAWSRGQWLAALGLGLALGGMNVFIYVAFATVPIGIAVTIEFLGPLTLSLVRTTRWRDLLWALLALAGVMLLGTGAIGASAFSGLLFAALAAVCWAGYIVMNQRVGAVIRGVDGLPVSMLVAMVVSLPFGVSSAVRGVVAQPLVLVVFAGVAVLASVLPYALEMVALRRMQTRVFGVLQSLGPAIAALTGFLVLGEALSVGEVVALVCITVASAGVTLGGRKARSDGAGPAAG